MSLFENPAYEWRETFFIMFDDANRPTLDQVRAAIRSLSGHLQSEGAEATPEGRFESITVYSPDDFAAMDITCAAPDEVSEQLPDIIGDLKATVSTADERAQLKRLAACTGRLDVYHFSKRMDDQDDSGDDDEFLDPGGLLALLERLATLCQGIVVDPQTGAFLN